MKNKGIQKFPISENILLRTSLLSYFEDIAKRLVKEKEIRLILESTIFHRELIDQAKLLRNSYLSFEEAIYPDRKNILRENIRKFKE